MLAAGATAVLGVVAAVVVSGTARSERGGRG